MPKFQPKSPPSEARLRLGELHQARNAGAAEMREAQSRIDRLSALSQTAAPIRAKLAALDASEAHAFASWSRDPGSPAPAVDSAARTDLQRELAAAQATGDAAARATDGVRSEVAAAQAKVAEVEREIRFAAGLVALEELGPLADEAKAAVAKMDRLRMEGQALLRVIGSISIAADPDAPGFSDFNSEWAKVSEAVTLAFSRALPNEPAEHEFIGKVNRLLAELHVDANARIED
jgi:hypothetical protein